MAPAVESRTQELVRLLQEKQRLLVLTHTNPDPDSLGSAMGLSLLARKAADLSSDFGLCGRIMRAENKEMVGRLSGEILPMIPMEELKLSDYDCVAVVDTQPGFGHTYLPKGRNVDIVVDHHLGPELPNGLAPEFMDVRTDVGATSSLITSYLMDQNIDVPANIATALYYGIRTDTADLSRNVSEIDVEAYSYLSSKLDRDDLAAISRPELPLEYFRALREALNHVRLFDYVVICSLGKIESPEMVAEVADMLLRIQDRDVVFCGGLVGSTYHLSIRTAAFGCPDGYDLMKSALGGEGSFGGHGTVAGGSLPVEDDCPRALRRLERRLEKNLLKSLGLDKLEVGRLG